MAEKFKGSEGSASAKTLSSKLTAENVKAVSLEAAGLPRDKVPSEVGLALNAAVYELLSESVGQRTYVGLKITVETIKWRLAGIDGEVAEGGLVDVGEFLWNAILARQRDLLRWAASGFQGKFEPARGFSPEDEKKWLRLEASIACDQRAWKKSKRNGADKEVKNEKGIMGGIPYCSRYLQDTGYTMTNCNFLHIVKKDIPCVFLREGGTCKKGDMYDWKNKERQGRSGLKA
jgi:hypothetical protein